MYSSTRSLTNQSRRLSSGRPPSKSQAGPAQTVPRSTGRGACSSRRKLNCPSARQYHADELAEMSLPKSLTQKLLGNLIRKQSLSGKEGASCAAVVTRPVGVGSVGRRGWVSYREGLGRRSRCTAPGCSPPAAPGTRCAASTDTRHTAGQRSHRAGPPPTGALPQPSFTQQSQ